MAWSSSSTEALKAAEVERFSGMELRRLPLSPAPQELENLGVNACSKNALDEGANDRLDFLPIECSMAKLPVLQGGTIPARSADVALSDSPVLHYNSGPRSFSTTQLLGRQAPVPEHFHSWHAGEWFSPESADLSFIFTVQVNLVQHSGEQPGNLIPKVSKALHGVAPSGFSSHMVSAMAFPSVSLLGLSSPFSLSGMYMYEMPT